MEMPVPERINPFDVLTSPAEVHSFMMESLGVSLRQTQAVEYLANHDELTGLPNRRAFEKKLADIETNGSIGQYAILFADGDNFKAINDMISYSRGDDILKATANALSSAIRSEDTVYRVGGDEFVALLNLSNHRRSEAIATDTQLEIIGERISNNLAKLLDDNPDVKALRNDLSVGIARPNDDSTLESLKAAAEEDMKNKKDLSHKQYGQYRS